MAKEEQAEKPPLTQESNPPIQENPLLRQPLEKGAQPDKKE